jgi:VanZ family protein
MRSSTFIIGCRILLSVSLVIITYLAIIPLTLPEGYAVSDKVLHALAFTVLLALVDYSWPVSGLNLTKVIPLTAYGAMLEVMQYYLPYRECSIADLIADLFGMMVYFALVPLLKRLPLFKRRWTMGS